MVLIKPHLGFKKQKKFLTSLKRLGKLLRQILPQHKQDKTLMTLNCSLWLNRLLEKERLEFLLLKSLVDLQRNIQEPSHGLSKKLLNWMF